MTGYTTIKKIRDFEERATRLGFRLIDPSERQQAYSAYSTATSSFKGMWIDEMNDTVSLAPADDRYPCWRRGSSVFTGTIEEAKFFFQGVEFSQVSDDSIGLTNGKKRARAETKYIERMARLEAARKKKDEQKRMWKILKDEVNDEVPF